MASPMRYSVIFLLCFSCGNSGSFAANETTDTEQSKPSAGMLRFPDVSDTQIVFSHAGDLWTAPRNGGTATPLASPAGQELFPRFSPDGKTIAFVGNYEGDQDIYTIPSAGGTAERITYHPATEILCDWTSDGRLIYSTNGYAGLRRIAQLFEISPNQPLPRQLKVPYGSNASLHEAGRWLAYTPHSRDTRTWKRYRGGMASDIWLFNLETNESKQITNWEGTDSLPMWHGDTVYYLSDDGPQQKLNIWAYEMDSDQRRQVTQFEDFDCKWPSIGPGPEGDGEIVVQNGANLWLVNLQDGNVQSIDITIPGDKPTVRRKKFDASKFIQSGEISPTGKRVVVEARGDIWSLPAKKGSPRNMTRTSGTAERMPSWSPDGRWIAFFSDQTGEYELFVMQSDGRGETRQLTNDGKAYRYDPVWSPDSKHVVFTDKAGHVFLHTIASEETQLVETEPFAQRPDVSWSHDSAWITYARSSDERAPTSTVWVYNVGTGEKTQITSGFFNCDNPTFDRKGDYVFCSSHRAFNQPRYEDVGTTFIYADTEVLLAIPLRADVEIPLLPESDEETWKDDSKSDEEKSDDEKSDDEKSDDEKSDDGKDADDKDETDEPADDENNVSGSYSGEVLNDDMPDEMRGFTLVLEVAADNSVTGRVETAQGTIDIESGKFDPETGEITLTASNDEMTVEITGTIRDGAFEGKAEVNGGEMSLDLQAKQEKAGGKEEEEKSQDKKEADKPVEIEFDGIVKRTFQLPMKQGNFGRLTVNDKNQLIYARVSGRGPGGKSSIQLFDLTDDKRTEKTVVEGAANFRRSADGKKLAVLKGEDVYVIDAAAGQKLSSKVQTDGMQVTVDPRQEWKQIFMDAWRIERDFIYDPTMHGVDWQAVRERYEPMIDEATSRSDVGFIIGEMISEINVGHAYYRPPRDPDSPEEENVGLLGCRFDVENDRYKIAEIYEGSDWDTDARNPLRQLGIKENDFVLAVNGVELDSSQNPYAAFVGMAGLTVTLTISDDAALDKDDRQVVVKLMDDDSNLRFRGWIEKNRRHVAERTSGRVGYIYVVNTGVPGQNDLFRQFYGQASKEGLIIDDRWNGGGQIPTRFIELLNRPVTNYWAKRDGRDWTWPPDSHQGPKCMLINGMAGSGGDMFPALFRQAGLGKLIGMRTWGGLVGISGNPQMIDGSSVTAPTFAFYEQDGTWGIEGHGVDPDVRVVDDPAKMIGGGDPQLDAAIDHMLAELEANPYRQPERPSYPDRRTIGIAEADK